MHRQSQHMYSFALHSRKLCLDCLHPGDAAINANRAKREECENIWHLCETREAIGPFRPKVVVNKPFVHICFLEGEGH